MPNIPDTSKIVIPSSMDARAAAMLAKANQPVTPIPTNREGEPMMDMMQAGVTGTLPERFERMSNHQAASDLFADLNMAQRLFVSAVTSSTESGERRLQWTADSGDLMSTSLSSSLLDIVREHVTALLGLDSVGIDQIFNDMNMKSGAHPVLIMPENAVQRLIDGAANNDHRRVAARQAGATATNESLAVKATKLGIDLRQASFTSLGLLSDPRRTAENTATTLESRPGYRLIVEHFSSQPRRAQEPKAPYNPKLSIDLPEAQLNVIDPATGLRKTITAQAQKGDLDYIEIVDNPAYLLGPRYGSRHARKTYHSALESFSSTTGGSNTITTFGVSMMGQNHAINALKQQLALKSRRGRQVPVDRVMPSTTFDREAVGEPMIMRLPGESLIPITQPGRPSEHELYMLPLDEDGYPISSDSEFRFAPDTYSSSNNNGSMMNGIMQRAAAQFGQAAAYNMSETSHQRYLIRMFSEIFQNDIMLRLSQSGFGNALITPRETSKFYEIMVARALAGRMTRMLIIPREYVVYFALEYDRYGFGRSAMDKSETINLIRSSALVARMMANAKNAVNSTNVEVKLDPRDPDPETRLAQVSDRIVRSRTATIPRGYDLGEQMAWMSKMGVQINASGHPDIPDMRVDATQRAPSYQPPDDGLADECKRTGIMHFHMPPELVDQSESPEFAANITSMNAMVKLVVSDTLARLNPLFTRAAHMAAKFSEPLKAKALTAIRSSDKTKDLRLTTKDLEEVLGPPQSGPYTDEHVFEYTLQLFLECIDVTFPRPADGTVTQRLDRFSAHEQALDTVLRKAIMSQDIFTADTLGENGPPLAESYLNLIKAQLLRQYMLDNDYMPELLALTQPEEQGGKINGKALSDAVQYAKSLMLALGTSKLQLSPAIKAFDADLAGMGGAEGGGGGASESSGSQESDSSDDGGGDDGGDGFGDIPSFDDGAGAGDEPAASDKPDDGEDHATSVDA